MTLYGNNLVLLIVQIKTTVMTLYCNNLAIYSTNNYHENTMKKIIESYYSMIANTKVTVEMTYQSCGHEKFCRKNRRQNCCKKCKKNGFVKR